ncbi:hypothetical protein CPB83DRAFT_859241 [Crepidotus variabilis]|uniref:Uncharacterized protein n=1 Tax=Crepidotus variabilis TaxID=179855 RepID=A0A9P6EAN3_9AGAR|nr:hypothetical protein CPB83DRAFT_859241 [Crepidotus variabilis]
MAFLLIEDIRVGQPIYVYIWEGSKIASIFPNPSYGEGYLGIKKKSGSSPWLGVKRYVQDFDPLVFEIAAKTDDGRFGLRSRDTGKLVTHRGDWVYADGDRYDEYIATPVAKINEEQVYKLVAHTNLIWSPRLVFDTNFTSISAWNCNEDDDINSDQRGYEAYVSFRSAAA